MTSPSDILANPPCVVVPQCPSPTPGTLVLVVDGQRTEITLPDAKYATAAQLNEALVAAGVGGRIYVPTEAELEEQRRRQAEAEPAYRAMLIEGLSAEEPGDLAAAMKKLGYSSGRLDGLSTKALEALHSYLEPDSY